MPISSGVIAMTTSHHDRRQFGRRTTFLHAWIRIPGRPPLPCIVRNLSVKGALLELDVPDWLPYEFRLRIDASGFDVDCELRHKGKNGCGVMFVEHDGARDRPADRQVLESDAWTGTPAQSAPRRERH
jgi:hypothetical protein